MKKLILGFSIAMLSVFTLRAQEMNLNTTPYVSVVGKAHVELTPDEIYVRFVLKERYEGKTKIELESIDKDLLKKMKSAGFDLSQLTVANAGMTFTPIKRKIEDVLAVKTYKIKLTKVEELNKLWEILDEVKVKSATVYDADLSNREEVEQDMRKKAVQDAKQKAEAMLGELGNKVGSLLLLEEQNIYVQPYLARNVMMNVAYESKLSSSAEDSSLGEEVEFEKIKIESKVQVRFSIK